MQRYDDGLDDFDRDLLGQGPLHRSEHPDRTIDRCRQQPRGYFPTPDASYVLSSPNRRGAAYEAILLPSPSIEPAPLRQSPLFGDFRHGAATQRDFRGDSTHLFRNQGAAVHTETPPVYPESLGRAFQTRQFHESSFRGPDSSSPTARLSSRKRRLASPPFTRAPNNSNPSSSGRGISTAQDDPQASTPVVHGIPLVSLRQALPDKSRAIFPYELLNAVQSKCFSLVYNTNDNLVVAAPTGSGKTAILELAICKLALDRGNENFKIVYQAPTKALCSEKARDWDKKFGHMNLKCAELTGDTSLAEMRRVGDASIIVTTPEKWDSVTRKWHDHRKLLQMVELFLIDEVHILKDARGATLEAVVSRMKAIGANVRFIALSATVPNSEDIARWLGRNHTNQQLPAHREAFGEEFRPVKLQKFVYGFESNSNDFIFDKFLDQKLPGLIHRHARQKPILVFCFTRKSCESTAALLAEFASDRPEGEKLWPVPSQRVPVLNRELQEIVKFGVAFHHAGLDVQDRTAIEHNFLKGQVGVICCTSTLAVGINLPCHTVVLKGTVGFADERLQEYSDLEVMQMLGRAGRPQFDDSATAIILTRAANKERYQKMVSGQEVLESTLHLNLIEHLNSEICLGTIHSLASAKTWLAGTFLSVRLRRNPNHYQLTGGVTSPSEIDDRLEEICERDIRQLHEAELVSDQGELRCTEYGRAMSKYMVEFHTMKLLLQVPRGVGMETLITILSQASEFKEFRFKPAERALFREINQSPLILYPVKEAVNQTRHKVSLMIQAHLGCVQYPDSSEAAKARRQLNIERRLVFERLNRLIRAVIDCKGHDRDSVGTKTALEFARALAAESWEGRATQLTQVPSIGPVGMRKLASKDIRTVLQLADKDYDEIERLMSRQPPFGRNVQAALDKFPRLDLEVAVVGHRVQPRSPEPVIIEVKATLRYLNRKGPPHWLNRVPALTFLSETSDGTLVYFWRGSMRKLDKQAGFDLKFSVGLHDANTHVVCHFSCEDIVGTIVSRTVQHNLSASAFPSRPVPAAANSNQSKSHADQEYLDNDDIDDSDLIMAAEQALAQPSRSQEQRGTSQRDADEYPAVEKLLKTVGSDSRARDRFDSHLAGNDDEDEEAEAKQPAREPVRLPNGRWQCNHNCSGGAPTKSGRPCSHRCCKEGLDKPRKPPLQRPKRKVDEQMEELAEPKQSAPAPTRRQPPAPNTELESRTHSPAKRPKTHHGSAPLAQTTLAFQSNSSSRVPQSTWKSSDFDAMDLECIDLSLTDDENEDFLKSSRETFTAAPGTGMPSKPTPAGTASDRDTDHNVPSTAMPRVHHNTAPVRDPLKDITGVTVTDPGAAKQNDDNEYFDDDSFSLFGEAFSPETYGTLSRTPNAFKAGASDEVLFQEMSGKSVEREDCRKIDVCRMLSSGGPNGNAISTPSLVGETLAAAEKTTPLGTTTVAGSEMSPDAENGTPLDVDMAKQVSERQVSKADEPAWVAEFDPEFVDMFRGYVTFV